MPARWIFQTAAITPRQVDAAAHKALLLLVVPLVMATAALTAGPLWGVRVAGLHALYCGALSILLCEVLLIRYRGIPLTRPYVAGGSRFHLLWAVYLSLFLTYTAWFCGFALVFWARRKFKLREATEIPFEPDMPDDQMFQGFNLTEMYAAQSVAPRANGSAKFPV